MAVAAERRQGGNMSKATNISLAWNLLLILSQFTCTLANGEHVVSNGNNLVATSEALTCRNPNGRLGICISILDCEPIKTVLRQRLADRYEFVRMCQCGDRSGNYPNVCCTRDTQLIERDGRVIFPDDQRAPRLISSSTSSSSSITADPSTVQPFEVEIVRPSDRQANSSKNPSTCGQAGIVVQRIFGGEAADLAEFSWLVAFEYRNAHGALVLDCAGSLVNARYVLTAAHCVRGPIERKVGKFESMRIGEHNTESDVDCNAHGCIPQYQRHWPERVVVHEQYGAPALQGQHEQHDIGLVRTREPVVLTAYLQPICLPAFGTDEFAAGANFTVAGWGHTGFAKRSAELRKVQVPLVERAACRAIFASKFNLSEEQLCAGGNFREDSCSGDSGGPLMRLDDFSWTLEGIVSFGKGCGVEHRPAVYTRVRSYLSWLDEHMEDV